MSGESDRIAALRAIYGSAHEGVELAIGDDAAVLAPGIVLSVDAAIEDVHFRRRWIGRGASWSDVGYRATVAALSDLAAMGARARAILSSLTLPSDVDDAVMLEITRGIQAASLEHGAPVIGGNLSRAREIGIHTTVIGAAGPRVLRRDGARAGDSIWASGPLGESALGLAALDADRAGEALLAPFARRFLAPRARIDLAGRLAMSCSAAIDLSDGLVRDLGHLCAASGVRAIVELDALPRAADHVAAARALGLEPLAALLAGGEDYELIVVGPGSTALRDEAIRIGEIVEGAGVVVRDASGRTISTGSTGHDHFA